jgi:hypothetical protein
MIMEMTAPKNNNPWFSIWTEPRATMRRILDTDPEYMVFLLGILLGVADSIGRLYARNSGDMFTIPAIFVLGAIMGPIGGLTVLYGASALLKLTGKLLGGGQGTYTHIRAAFAWSSVPLIWGVFLWLPGAALFGEELFTKETPRIDSSVILSITSGFFGVLQVVLFFWSFIVFLKCLAEAQRFSAWKALFNVLLSFALFTVVILAFVWTKKLV